MKPFNAQDAFSKLVEEVRIGQVRRPIATERPVGTKFVPHKVNIDLDIPMFYLIGDHHHIPFDDATKAIDQIVDKTFHLPYPRCGFMMSLPGTHPGLQHLDRRFHVRHTYIVVVEEDDEGLHFIPFMTNELIGHWARQLFDIYMMFGSDEIVTTYDPAWGDFPSDFISRVEASLWLRLAANLGLVYQLMNRQGVAASLPGTQVTDKINSRRSKMDLPSVPLVTAIDLNRMPSVSLSLGSGSPKRPLFRRGSWHTRKATGKRSWHPPVAVHGGGQVIPPWYEVRAQT